MSYFVACGTRIIHTSLCFTENKKRDRLRLRTDTEKEALEEFEDLTDKENLHFRYRI